MDGLNMLDNIGMSLEEIFVVGRRTCMPLICGLRKGQPDGMLE